MSPRLAAMPPSADPVCDRRGCNLEITNTLGNQQHAYEGGHFSGASFAPALGIFGKVTLVG